MSGRCVNAEGGREVGIPFRSEIAYNHIMDAKPFSPMTNRTKLAISLVLAAILLAVGLQWYRQQDEVSDVLLRQGPDAARQGIGLSQEGVKLLPPEERQELGS